MHIPLICEDKNVPYVFLPNKTTIGRACGSARSIIAATITSNDASDLAPLIESIKNKVERLSIWEIVMEIGKCGGIFDYCSLETFCILRWCFRWSSCRDGYCSIPLSHLWFPILAYCLFQRNRIQYNLPSSISDDFTLLGSTVDHMLWCMAWIEIPHHSPWGLTRCWYCTSYIACRTVHIVMWDGF